MRSIILMSYYLRTSDSNEVANIISNKKKSINGVRDTRNIYSIYRKGHLIDLFILSISLYEIRNFIIYILYIM